MQLAKLMTNITPQYYSFIEKEAERSNRSKREIIEEAIGFYIKELKKKRVMAQYKALSDDQEYQNELVENAELGMEYYLSELENDN